MLNPKEHRHRSSARRSGECKQPGRRRWRLADHVDRRPEGGWRKSASVEVVDCLHGGGHTVHVNAGWIGRLDRDEPGVPVSGLKFQLAPARN